MNLKKNILVIVLVAVIIGTGVMWYLYFGSTPKEPVTRVSEEEDEATKDLVSMLATLQSLRIDTAFFDDPIYKSLIDFSPTIERPDDIGRENPFLPLE